MSDGRIITKKRRRNEYLRVKTSPVVTRVDFHDLKGRRKRRSLQEYCTKISLYIHLQWPLPQGKPYFYISGRSSRKQESEERGIEKGKKKRSYVCTPNLDIVGTTLVLRFSFTYFRMEFYHLYFLVPELP